MVQTAFLDTCIILDYIENRKREVSDIIAQLLLLHKKGRIILATSIFNVAELIHNEFEIHFIGWCLKERMPYDEILGKLRRDEKLFREVSEKNKKSVEKRISDFIFKKEIRILSPNFADEEQYRELYNLIYEYQFFPQDALIVYTALTNKVTYFLSNDNSLIQKIIKNGLLDAYNLREPKHRKSFRDNVLEAI